MSTGVLQVNVIARNTFLDLYHLTFHDHGASLGEFQTHEEGEVLQRQHDVVHAVSV
jgi:hypothetical protein